MGWIRGISYYFVFILVCTGLAAAPFYKKRSIPKAFSQTFQKSGVKLTIAARNVAQGEMVYLVAEFEKPQTKVQLRWHKDNVPMSTKPGAKRFDGIYGISTKAKVGKHKLRLKWWDSEDDEFETSFDIKVKKTNFYVKKIPSQLKVKKKYTAPKKVDIDRIKKERKVKQKVFRIRSNRKWQGRFIDARNMARVNSPFYGRRVYNNGKSSSHHSGVDLKGRIGAPIKAMNRGKVVLARNMHYEGNLTVLDHGEGFFSYYMHQSKILVKEGQMVKKGQLIGRVGNTGMVTGPHLHLSVKYRGRLQSPLSLLSLPVE